MSAMHDTSTQVHLTRSARNLATTPPPGQTVPFLETAMLTEAPSPNETWLDLLPPELTRQVVACLRYNQSDDNALPLAHTSARLGAAVKAALIDTFMTTNPTLETVWDTVLGRLHLDFSDSLVAARHDSLAKILREGGWDKADVTTTDNVVVSLKDSAMSKLLEVYPTHGERLKSLVNVIFAERMKNLRIRCGCSFSVAFRGCPVGRAMDYLVGSETVAESNVEKLDIDCWESRFIGYGAILSVFTNLREVTLHGLSTLADEVVTRLIQMEAVHVHCRFKTDIHVAKRFASVVPTLDFTPVKGFLEPLSAADLCDISVFKVLSSLTAVVAHGAETGLAALPSALRVLRLEWNFAIFGRAGCPMVPVGEGHYYKPLPLAIVNFVRRSPHLSVLDLGNAVMFCNDVVDIVQAMGARLLEFAVCVPCDALTLEKLPVVVEQMAASSRYVRKFELHVPQQGLLAGYGISSEVRASPQAGRLFAALGVLRRHAPSLDSYPLEEVINALLRWTSWRSTSSEEIVICDQLLDEAEEIPSFDF